MKIVKNYAHGTHGEIGTVTLEILEDAIKLNGKELPVSSENFLIAWIMKPFENSYASAKTQAECQAGLAKKVDSLQAGTVRKQAASITFTDREEEIERLIRSELKARQGETWDNYKKIKSKNKSIERALEIFNAQGTKTKEAIEAEVKKRLEASKTSFSIAM